MKNVGVRSRGADERDDNAKMVTMTTTMTSGCSGDFSPSHVVIFLFSSSSLPLHPSLRMMEEEAFDGGRRWRIVRDASESRGGGRVAARRRRRLSGVRGDGNVCVVRTRTNIILQLYIHRHHLLAAVKFDRCIDEIFSAHDLIIICHRRQHQQTDENNNSFILQ